LGHAYVLADDLPHAILSLQRGLRLAPNDRDLRRSLTEARALVVYSASNPLGRPAVEVRPLWFPAWSPTWLIGAGFLGYAGICIFVTRWLMTRNGWLLPVSVLCLIAAALATWLLIDTEHRRNVDAERTLVVIADDDVLLRKGDSLEYPKRYEAT